MSSVSCPRCSKPVVRQGKRGPMPTHCSYECRRADYLDKGGREVKAASAKARYEAEKAERHAQLAPCVYCGGVVSHGRAKTCGADECERLRNAENQRNFQRAYRAEHGRAYTHRWAEDRAEATQRRRAIEAGVKVETFDRVEVFERDCWMCWLCEKPVDPSVEHPDSGSASLDHITPISKGGEHSRANTRCSHLGCNSARGNRAA